MNGYLITFFYFGALQDDLDWNDSDFSLAFRQGLPTRIKDDLARYHFQPRPLLEIVELVARINLQFWDRELERSQEPPPLSSTRSSSTDDFSSGTSHTQGQPSTSVQNLHFDDTMSSASDGSSRAPSLSESDTESILEEFASLTQSL